MHSSEELLNNKHQLSLLKDALKSLSEEMYKHPQVIANNLSLGTIKSQFSCDKNNTSTHHINIRSVDYTDPCYVKEYILGDLLKIDKFKKIVENVFNLMKGSKFDEWGYDFNDDLCRRPGIISTFIIGFLISNLKYSRSKFDENSFHDLINFVSRDTMDISIKMILGKQVEMKDSIDYKEIKIFKVTELDQIIFNATYGVPQHYATINHNNVIVEYKTHIPRSCKSFYSYFNFESRAIQEKILRMLTLSSNGNISTISPILCTHPKYEYYRSGSLRQCPDSYHQNFQNEKNFVSTFDYNFANRLKLFYDELFEFPFHKCDDFRIEKAFYRFKKAKAAENIDDKVIELMTGMEYLINTSSYEVTLQITQYIIKLLPLNLNVENRLNLSKILKSAYSLRSDVVHGKKIIELTETNMRTLKQTELILLEIFFRIIVIIYKYNYDLDKIHQALKDALYSDENFYNALHRRNTSLELLTDDKVMNFHCFQF